MDLIEFINARLDEDEQTALGVTSGARQPEEWIARQSKFTNRALRTCSVDCPFGAIVVDGAHQGVATHIARHDPVRVLRGVAAKRAILDAHLKNPTGTGFTGHYNCRTCIDPDTRDDYPEAWASVRWPCQTLRALASEWSDHAAYRTEWTPT